MATLGAGKTTLVDVVGSLAPDGSVHALAELMTQMNEVLIDMPWKEGNLPTGHEAAVRTGIPSATWRKYYGGVPPTKSTRAKVQDACAMLEIRTEIDADLANLNGNSAEFRLSESLAEIEGTNQTFCAGLMYGNTGTNPEQILGFMPRYSSLSAVSGQNVITGGGAGADNASGLLVGWSQNTICGIYPKGSVGGLQHKPLPEYDAFDASNNRFRAVGDLYKWACGLHVRDWRYCVRIPNIDISDLKGQSGTQTLTAVTNILNLMIQAIHRLPSRNMCTPVFYFNRTIRAALDWMALNKSSTALSISEAAGQLTTSFLGFPIRTCDQLLSTETVVS